MQSHPAGDDAGGREVVAPGGAGRDLRRVGSGRRRLREGCKERFKAGQVGQAFLALLFFLNAGSLNGRRLAIIDDDYFDISNGRTQILLAEGADQHRLGGPVLDLVPLRPIEVPLEDFMKLTKIPICIVYGDNIPTSPDPVLARDGRRCQVLAATVRRAT